MDFLILVKSLQWHYLASQRAQHYRGLLNMQSLHIQLPVMLGMVFHPRHSAHVRPHHVQAAVSQSFFFFFFGKHFLCS